MISVEDAKENPWKVARAYSSLYYYAKDFADFQDLLPEPHLRWCEDIACSPILLSKCCGQTLSMEIYPARCPRCGRHIDFLKDGQVERRYKEVQPYTLLVYPRGTYKTSLFIVSKAPWLLLRNPDLRFFEFQFNEDKACKIVRSIQAVLTNEAHEKILAPGLFELPSFIPSSYQREHGYQWSESGLKFDIATRKNRTAKEANVTAMGRGSNWTGDHCDEFDGDDIVTKEDRDSDPVREENCQILREVFPLLDTGARKQSKVQMSGTPYHPMDMYTAIEEQTQKSTEWGRPLWTIRRESCYLDDEVTPRFPDFPPMSAQKLVETELLIGTADFSTQYRLKHVSTQMLLFPPTVLHNYPPETFPEFYVFAIDLSMGKTKRGDPSVILALGAQTSKALVDGAPPYIANVMYSSRAIRTPSQIIVDLREMIDEISQWAPVRAGVVETNAAQALFVDHRDVDMRFRVINEKEEEIGRYFEATGIPVYYRNHTSEEHKQARIRGLERYVRSGYIRFPWDFKTRWTGEYIEFTNFRAVGKNTHDDWEDTLEMALELLYGPHLKEAFNSFAMTGAQMSGDPDRLPTVQELRDRGMSEAWIKTLSEHGQVAGAGVNEGMTIERDGSGSEIIRFNTSDGWAKLRANIGKLPGGPFGGLERHPTTGRPIR